jgi:DNA-directed RNA polymerase specialized sigma24 family protein|tara:strand:- start:547 stop:1020 length:474 start_codon:yes stop_codon:yes gene_type:complete
LQLDERKELVKQVSRLLSSLTKEEKEEVFSKVLKEKKGIPISVFSAEISSLEIIVKYLKDVENFSFKKISSVLNRQLSTLYTTYHKADLKFKNSFDVSDKSVLIPFDLFVNRKYSVLESIVAYLVKEGFSLVKIANLLGKNYNTVKTVYRRYKIKNA